jgi:hypothetical protein
MDGFTRLVTTRRRAALKADESFMRNWKSVEQGAATSVSATVDKELEGVGGVYLEDCGIVELRE